MTMDSDFAGYFDYAAATPVDPRVVAVMRDYFSENFYNPSATYDKARQVKASLDEARANIALILGCKPIELTFTAGGTEANNLAIQGVMNRFPKGKILISAAEHDSVLKTAAKYNFCEIPLLPNGAIDLEWLEKNLSDDVVLVSVMYANNEIGTIQPIRKVTQLVEAARARRRQNGDDTALYCHTDASQAALYLDLHVHRLGVDLLTLNGGKMYGPKQTGALFVKSGIVLEPLIYGGGQEHDLRNGTENVAGSAGMSTALQIAQSEREEEVIRLQKLQQLLISELSVDERISVNGTLKKRLPNNVHITILGFDNESLVMKLDTLGFMVSVGSACSASHEEPSHVLRAIGLPEDKIRSSLRITLGRFSTEQDVIKLTEALLSLLA